MSTDLFEANAHLELTGTHINSKMTVNILGMLKAQLSLSASYNGAPTNWGPMKFQAKINAEAVTDQLVAVLKKLQDNAMNVAAKVCTATDFRQCVVFWSWFQINPFYSSSSR